MNGLASPPTEVCRIVNRQKTRSQSTSLRTRILRLNRETKLTKTGQFIMTHGIDEILGVRVISTSVPPPRFRGPSLAAVPYVSASVEVTSEISVIYVYFVLLFPTFNVNLTTNLSKIQSHAIPLRITMIMTKSIKI